MGILTPKESEAMAEEMSRAIEDSRQTPYPYLVNQLTDIAQRHARPHDARPSTQRRRRRKVVLPPVARELLSYLSRYGGLFDDMMDFGEWELRVRWCELPACQEVFLDTSPTWHSRPARFCCDQHRARFAKLPR